ncbi:hypothetical protein PT974_03557 [Cladobotryum mycophilum]|uniref:Uncharacterized protein n=1 Tax=Cladobotryum mycophilum TaxID=491253 RepID=A0ABR0STQ4_9HYPO
MSPIVTRIASRVAQLAVHHAAFCTTAQSLKPAGSEAAVSASTSWWKNLSPQTRRYVGYGIGVCLVADSYVVYNYYPEILGPSERKGE